MIPRPRRDAPSLGLVCPVCGEAFTRAPYELKRLKPGGASCCSYECAAKWKVWRQHGKTKQQEKP